MRQVKIYQPAKSTMQSGRGKTAFWLLEYELESKRTPEPLMGWVASKDTLNQVRMRFETKEEAVAFAEKNGWAAQIAEPQARKLKGRTYMDNFKYIPPKSSSGK